MTDRRLGWKYLGSWVKGASNASLKLAESFDCWKWVNYFLVAVQLIGAGTWRPEDPDFWMCVRLSRCVCVCVCLCLSFISFCFILYCFYTNLALYFRRSLCADRKRNPEFRSTVTKRRSNKKNGRSRTRWVYGGTATAVVVQQCCNCNWKWNYCSINMTDRPFHARSRSCGHASQSRAHGQPGLDDA